MDLFYDDKFCKYPPYFRSSNRSTIFMQKRSISPVPRNMSVRRLFSRGGQKFSGGARTYFLPKKQRKRYYFFPKKVLEHTIFGQPWPALAGQGGGKGPPCPPLRTPMPRKLVTCTDSAKLGKTRKGKKTYLIVIGSFRTVQDEKTKSLQKEKIEELTN